MKRPRRKTGGRRKGTPNRTTKAFKEAVLVAFRRMGGSRGLERWGRKNQTEFYKIAARLIPHEVTSPSDEPAQPLRIELTDATASNPEPGL